VISPITPRWLSVKTSSYAASKARRRARRYVLQLSAIVTKSSDAQNKLGSRSPIRYSIRNAGSVGSSSGPERLISAIGVE
jgi:hypothetical protein